MLTTMIVSVRVPMRPTPASLPNKTMLRRSRPSQNRGGSVVVVVVEVVVGASVVTDWATAVVDVASGTAVVVVAGIVVVGPTAAVQAVVNRARLKSPAAGRPSRVFGFTRHPRFTVTVLRAPGLERSCCLYCRIAQRQGAR